MSQNTSGPLIVISSAYRRAGVVWEAFARDYGPKGDPRTLVARGTTIDFNPSVAQEEIDAKLRRDGLKGRSEYLSEFRDDVSNFLELAAIRACVAREVHERPHDPNVKYMAFVDCAGGTGEDASALAVGHKSGATVILDLVRHVEPRFDPETVLQEFAEDLRRYRCKRVVGDGWAKGFPEAIFRRCGVTYVQADRNRSQYYLELLPIINSRACELLDNKRLVTELAALERSPARSGRDVVDHPPRQHDDLSNAVAGCLVNAWALKGDGRDFARRDYGGGGDLPVYANRGYASLKGDPPRPPHPQGGYSFRPPPRLMRRRARASSARLTMRPNSTASRGRRARMLGIQI